MDTEQFKVGDRVWWDDPDNGACSGKFTVQCVGEEGDEIVTITPDGKGVTEVYANELTKLRKYRVHGYHVVRVPFEVEAKSQLDAIQVYDNEFRTGMLFGKDAESAEEINAYLVDEVGDEEYEKSEFYCADGETPADNLCTQCLRYNGTKKYWLVAGRVEGDWEDTVGVHFCASEEEAVAAFKEAMTDSTVDFEDIPEEDRPTIYINTVASSKSVIDITTEQL